MPASKVLTVERKKEVPASSNCYRLIREDTVIGLLEKVGRPFMLWNSKLCLSVLFLPTMLIYYADENSFVIIVKLKFFFQIILKK